MQNGWKKANGQKKNIDCKHHHVTHYVSVLYTNIFRRISFHFEASKISTLHLLCDCDGMRCNMRSKYAHSLNIYMPFIQNIFPASLQFIYILFLLVRHFLLLFLFIYYYSLFLFRQFRLIIARVASLFVCIYIE